MDFKNLFDMVRDLARRGFYGTLQIEFKNGKPYLGIRTERVLLDKPFVPSIVHSTPVMNNFKDKEA